MDKGERYLKAIEDLDKAKIEYFIAREKMVKAENEHFEAQKAYETIKK